MSKSGALTGTYSFDLFGRMTSATVGNTLATYTYDSSGIRTSKTVNGVTTNFINDNGYVVGEVSGESIIKYTYGNGLVNINNNGTIGYYFTDEHGNVSVITDGTKVIVADYDFDAFGNEIVTTADYYNPMRYCGEYQDLCSGLIYLRNRYYDPSIGRFITEDPARDGLNWYVYANNNPLMFIDPWGLAPTKEEAAYMAKHIYGDYDMSVNGIESRTVAGWRLIDVFDGGAASSIKLGVYIPDGDDWTNPSEYALVFRGSTTSLDMETASVWANKFIGIWFKRFCRHVGGNRSRNIF